MNATYEISVDAMAAIAKTLGKNKIGADKLINAARSSAMRCIINSDPFSPAQMRDQVKESLVSLHVGSRSGIDTADVIKCWAIAFPHDVGKIMECVISPDIPVKCDPHAEGYVLGLFEAANLIHVDDVDNNVHADNVICKFLSTAMGERWWDGPEFKLQSCTSGRLSGALSSYFDCWNKSLPVLQYRCKKVAELVINIDVKNGDIDVPNWNLHRSLANEIETKFLLAAPSYQRHLIIARGILALPSGETLIGVQKK